MALGSTQPLKEMSSRCVSCHQEYFWGKGGWCVRLTTYHHYSTIVKKSRSLNSPRPLRACMACYGGALPFNIRLPLSQETKICRSNMHTIRKDHPIFKYLGPVSTIGSASLQTRASQIFFTMFEEGVHNSRQADGALGLPTYVFKYRHRIYYR